MQTVNLFAVFVGKKQLDMEITQNQLNMKADAVMLVIENLLFQQELKN